MTIFGMISTESSLQFTKLALESFYYYTPLTDADSFIVIDNDGSAHSLAFPPIKNLTVLSNPTPLGFAANMNQVLRTGHDLSADCVLLNNDLIFTANWYKPFVLPDLLETIVVPLSNQQIRYGMSVVLPEAQSIAKTLLLQNPMQLSDYSGNEAAFAAIAEAHAGMGKGSFLVPIAPFFCVQIPASIIKAVGLFDEEFGRGGGEDFDYCMRAWLGGFKVAHVLQSFLLHFGGKSSFDSPSESANYEQQLATFKNHFKAKWGEKLSDLFLSFRPDFDLILGSEKEHYLNASPLEKIRSLLPAKIPEVRIF